MARESEAPREPDGARDLVDRSAPHLPTRWRALVVEQRRLGRIRRDGHGHQRQVDAVRGALTCRRTPSPSLGGGVDRHAEEPLERIRRGERADVCALENHAFFEAASPAPFAIGRCHQVVEGLTQGHGDRPKDSITSAASATSSRPSVACSSSASSTSFCRSRLNSSSPQPTYDNGLGSIGECRGNDFEVSGQCASMEPSVPDGHDDVDIRDGEGTGEMDGIGASQPVQACEFACLAFDGLAHLNGPVVPQNSSQACSACSNPSASRSRFRRAAASSPNLGVCQPARDSRAQPSQSWAARAVPGSSTTSFTKALESK